MLGWRDVPVDPEHCGVASGAVAPIIRQLFVAAGDGVEDHDALERKLYVIRRCVEKEDVPGFAIAGFSSRTLVYKGMLTAPQLSRYFPDLRHEQLASQLALVHSRFSTNTFPSWELAHPYRMLAHNGEINTLRGNRNWHARPRAARWPRRCSATTSTRSAGCCATTSPTRPRSTA